MEVLIVSATSMIVGAKIFVFRVMVALLFSGLYRQFHFPGRSVYGGLRADLQVRDFLLS